MKHSLDNLIMVIAALSFHVFINFLLLQKVGTKNIAFDTKEINKIVILALPIIEVC